jgi:uncharacterized protein (DUF1015 family)
MVTFLPFRGYTPLAGTDITQRVSPPYDVINDQEKRRLQSLPGNITRITLGVRDGNYQAARKELDDWIEKGMLVQSSKECFYLYRQTFVYEGKERTRTGIMGRLLIEPYEQGNILPHEETFSKVKEDRLNLLEATETHLESIFGIYEDIDRTIASALQAQSRELFHFKDSQGVKHSFLELKDEKTVASVVAMLKQKKMLIADGHHRYETSMRYSQEHPQDEKKRYVLATLVASDDTGLIVEPTHRILSSSGVTTEQLLSYAAKDFGLWEMQNLDQLTNALAGSKRVALGLATSDGRLFVAEHLGKPDQNPLWKVDAFICEKVLLQQTFKDLIDANASIEYDRHALVRRDPFPAGSRIDLDRSKGRQEDAKEVNLLLPEDLVWIRHLPDDLSGERHRTAQVASTTRCISMNRSGFFTKASLHSWLSK